MDVEGAESLILNGASDVLRRFQPIIFAEVHSPALLARCESILKGVGYELFDLSGRHIDTKAVIAEVTQIVASHRP
jgi:hypothetical protein